MNETTTNDSNSPASKLGRLMPTAKLPAGKTAKGAAAVAGVAAVAGMAFAAYKKFGNGSRAATIFHVQSTDDGWKVQREGSNEPEQCFQTKAEAVDVGRRLAHESEPSELFVYRTDGTVERRHNYGEAN